MGAFGNFLGSILGGLGSQILPINGINGKELGGTIGNLLPFSRGGRVGHRRRGRPRKALRKRK